MATEITALQNSSDGLAVSADGTTTTIFDLYEYGAPNPDRADLAVYLTAYKVDTDLEETAVVIEAFDTLTVDEFLMTNGVDGRYKFKYVQIELWDVATEYEEFDLVYDEGEEAFYEYINATPSTGNVVTNATYWTEVTDPTSKIDNVGEAEESGNLRYQVLEFILDYATAKCYGNVSVIVAKELCEAECNCSSKLCRSRNRLRTLLSVMRLSNTRQQYLQGERAAREAEKYCDECDCLEL